ncbi:hypothetical protein HK096_006416 [Nowakowskiella sp. JEL0078]|nr:hypothetical protein HK096_006416 [Nowakowskiella sp. JEL0078]
MSSLPPSLEPLAGLSSTLKSHASWRSLLVSLGAFIASFALVQRASDVLSFIVGAKIAQTRVFLSPSILSLNAFGYGPNAFVSIFAHFAGSGFGTAFSRLCYSGVFLLNFIPISIAGFLLSIFVSSGVEAIETIPTIAVAIPQTVKPILSLANLIPILSASLDVIENILLFFALISIGPIENSNGIPRFFSGLAGAVNVIKSIYALVTFGVVILALGVYAIKWTKAIGRDGRQKVEFKKQ